MRGRRRVHQSPAKLPFSDWGRAMRWLALWLMLPLTATAQPSNEPLGPSVLDTGSTMVRTERFTLPAEAGAEHEIGVLIPRREAPAEGFPVVFALDGQAVLELLTDEALTALPALPVIVTLGYETDRRFASEERARDYTPPSADGRPVEDPRGRPGGGAAAYLGLLETEVIPRVRTLAPVDMDRSTLWGHSYGGLFVLYAASRPETPFTQYVAASPSLWWDNGSFLARLETQVDRWPGRPLTIHKGELERARASHPDTPDAQRLAQMRTALPEDALEGFVSTLAAAGVAVDYEVFPGLSHGETFRRSIRFLLEGMDGAKRSRH